MIVTVSPGMRSCEHTLNALQYASHVKELVVNLNSIGQPCQEVFRFPRQLKDVKKPWNMQNCPKTAELQLFGVQADEEVSPQLFTFSTGGETQKRKEVGEKMLLEKHRESL